MFGTTFYVISSLLTIGFVFVMCMAKSAARGDAALERFQEERIKIQN